MGIMSFHLMRFASLEEAKKSLGFGVLGYDQPPCNSEEIALAGVYEGDFREFVRPGIVYPTAPKADVQARQEANPQSFY